MGGVLIVTVLVFTTMLWAEWNALVELTLLSVIVLAGLGFYDDYAKISKQSGGGTPPGVKLWSQAAVSVFIGVYLWMTPSTTKLVSEIMVPFCKLPVLTQAAPVGILIVVLAIVGTSNAVNLTDGLDGLAIGCSLIVAFVFLVFTYLAGNAKTAAYLAIPHVEGAGELTVFCAALLGAGLGFLWFNCHPAQVFMGDTGSLALGGAFGVVAVLIHQPFVLEAVSVMLQTGDVYKRQRPQRAVAGAGENLNGKESKKTGGGDPVRPGAESGFAVLADLRLCGGLRLAEK